MAVLKNKTQKNFTMISNNILRDKSLSMKDCGVLCTLCSLWNEVQKIEKRSDAQMAREVEVALPVELTREEQIACVRVFVKENFVNQGMIADWALHDKGDGNPHAHIMLTVRELDEGHAWMAKQRTVFANEAN